MFTATASYRLLPEITLTREVLGGQAVLLQSCFSPGVIGIDSEGRAYVKDARYDTCSRNIYRHDDIKDAALLSRIRNHFICMLNSDISLLKVYSMVWFCLCFNSFSVNVESVGAMAPNVIFVEAVKILRDKCKSLLDELNSF